MSVHGEGQGLADIYKSEEKITTIKTDKWRKRKTRASGVLEAT